MIDEKKLTIDEAIAHAREVAEENYKQGFLCHENPNDDELDGCIKCAKEHEQLAKWLEELKELRSMVRCNAFKDGYNKAIDDFAEKLSAKCDGMIKDKWNSNVAPISWAEAYADFKDDIDDIAEQLKEKEK